MKKKYILLGIVVLVLMGIELLFLIINHVINNYNFGSETNIKNEVEVKEEEPKIEIEKASMFMVGDALIHSAVYGDADIGNGNGSYDFTSMLSEFSDIVSNYDLAFYNQETILGGTSLGLSSYPTFNSPYEVGDAFTNIGFNLVSLANNHTLDRGRNAIINSKNYWNQKNDVYTAGSYTSQEERDNVVIREVNGIRYAFFAYTESTNGISIPNGDNYLVDVYSNEKVYQDIMKVKNDVDVIIVSMHWGDEYSFSVSNRQREIASYLSSLGVKLIIGHHPHVVEEIEYVNDTLVIYSLGNFLSAQRGIDRLTGLMVSLDIVKTTVDGVSNITLENTKVGLTYTYSETINGYRSNFKVYPYQKLTETILPNYQMYYNKYLDIVLKNQLDIERW